MNIEKLIAQASFKIAEFSKTHNTSCGLFIRNGEVICLPRHQLPQKLPDRLYLTHGQIINGLKSEWWTLLGKELLNLYNKEQACQAHQKP